jgi:hypothetical protein
LQIPQISEIRRKCYVVYSSTAAQTAAAEYWFNFVHIEETEIIVGNIDGDGKTGKVNDIVMLAKYLKENIKLNSETLAKAQCTKGDSVIDTADLTALWNYISKHSVCLFPH